MNPRLDAIFKATRELFELPEGLVYLDGNSLGPLPKASREHVRHVIDEQWSSQLIKGWNDSGWIDLPQKVGDKIAKLVGAPAGSVIATDSTSVNLFKVLSAALEMQAHHTAQNPESAARRVVLSDTGNFPNDLYVAQGLLRALGDGPHGDGYELRMVEPEEVADAIDETVAVLMLTQTDYRTGRLHDMADLTRRAHEVGVLTVWDLAHSAGALPVHLDVSGADFAIGCGYKYLNGGPGAPAFVYVRPEHAAKARPALVGWMGHETPFAFDLDYRPAPTTDRMLVGTPPILAMASLDAALDVWDGVDLADVRERSIELSELFIAEVETLCPELELASPRDPQARASQVSFRFPEGYAVMQALIARDVIGDFRAPDMMRFGFTPLYLTPEEVVRAARVLETVLRDKLWDSPEYKRKSKVT
ncbi:MAG: kynureninase [Actinomycetota bacterium]|jgi:kynureninase|nr:kynureninase [Actinomycetota bacterium]